MSKKSKRAKQNKGSYSQIQQVDKWISLASHQVQAYTKNYAGAIDTCQRLLSYLPQKSPKRVQVLDYLGTAYGMLQDFPQSYEAYTEALSISPHDAVLWYNRGFSSRFTLRIGQSVRDFERAEMAMKERGPNFTLDQLIEQESRYQLGLKHMEAGEWEEAIQAFRHSIEMADILPQPWGNIGVCLIMQERYDEAEEALKRALEIYPQYAIAKRNLAALPETRRTGPPKAIGMTEPFKGSKLKQSLTFIRE